MSIASSSTATTTQGSPAGQSSSGPQGSSEFRICSVISGFLKMDEPVSMGGKQTKLTYEYNTGIVLSIGINHALDLIQAKPVGPPTVIIQPPVAGR